MADTWELWESSVLGPERHFPLHAIVTRCGVAEADSAAYRFDGLRRGKRPFAVLQYTLDGCGHLRFENQEYRLGPGALMSVVIPHDHVYSFESGPPWRFIYVCAAGSEVIRAVSASNRLTPVHALPADADLVRSMRRIVRTVRNNDLPSSYALSAAAYELAMQLLSLSAVHRADPRHTALVRRAQDFVRLHAADPLSVSDLAEAMGLSRAHFTRIFTESTGISPHRYIEEIRMRKAIDLLYATDMSAKEVGFACGFGDPHYFSKAFKRRTGQPPGAYRRSRM